MEEDEEIYAGWKGVAVTILFLVVLIALYWHELAKSKWVLSVYG